MCIRDRRWLASTPRARLLTTFLLVASVPVTMLFGALPFLLASRTSAGLPDWIRPTDVLFLTHYKALESIAAALFLGAWVRWAGASRRKPAAVRTAFAGYVASMAALVLAETALASALAAVALAASFSPLMVWVRTERAGLVPEHNRQRIAGLLVAVDATAYVLGALAVRYGGFEPASLAAIATVTAGGTIEETLTGAIPLIAGSDIPLGSLDAPFVATNSGQGLFVTLSGAVQLAGGVNYIVTPAR